MSFPRALSTLLEDPELSDKMLLIAGPRQVGKTTLAKTWLHHKKCDSLYYNWDDEKIRRQYRTDAVFFESEARLMGKEVRVVLDEIHKLSRWKTVLKGYYDRFEEFRFLITGSARLELFQRSGDSMLGRYHLLHLPPLSPFEIEKRKGGYHLPNLAHPKTVLEYLEHKPLLQDSLETLMRFSGFPAPFSKQSSRALTLWHREYRQRLIREDVRDLSRIPDLANVEAIFDLLPSRVGSPFSLNSLCGDISASHGAAKSAISALDRLYITLLIRPYSRKLSASLRKEPKLYLLDWTLVEEPGARFENWLAIALNSFCDYINDGGFAELELFYVRDKQKREVDFLIVKDKRPYVLIEAKLRKDDYPQSLHYFSHALGDIPAYCVTLEPNVFKKIDPKRWVISANRFLNLFWNNS